MRDSENIYHEICVYVCVGIYLGQKKSKVAIKEMAKWKLLQYVQIDWYSFNVM